MWGRGGASATDQMPKLRVRALHLAALAAVAVSQPLYDILGRNPIFFVARQMTVFETLLLTLGLAVVVPGLLLIVEVCAGLLSARLAWWTHLLMLWGLGVALALPLARRAVTGPRVTLLAAIVMAAILVFCYARFSAAKMFLTFLSLACVVFPVAFLLFTPVLRAVGEPVSVPQVEAPRLTGPLVMVVFDELPLISLLGRDHHIDAGRFPHFADLASTATWYPNAVTVSGSTPSSVTTILTGLRPRPESLPILSQHPRNLFTWMAGTGPIVALESATRLCPTRLQRANPPWREPTAARVEGLVRDLGIVYQHLVLPRQWTTRLPVIGDNWGRFAMRREEVDAFEDRPALFSSFVEEIRPSDTGLYFVHVFLPHLPWSRLPDGKSYTSRPWQVAGLDLRHENWVDDPWLVAQGYRRHLLQVELVDNLLGELLARLRATGLFESSLIVVTADHGCNFRPGRGRRALLPDSPLDVLGVPLLIKAPGQAAGRIDSAAIQTLDILPTLASLLGVEPPWPVDGQAVSSGSPRPQWPPEDWPGEESLDRKLSLFGEGRPELPRPGPLRQVLGLRASDLKQTAGELEVVFYDPKAFLEVDPASSFLPLLVSGRVRMSGAPAGDTLTLAITVNGVVRAVTRTGKPSHGWLPFSAMLSRGDLRKGENEVGALALDTAGSAGNADGLDRARRREEPTPLGR